MASKKAVIVFVVAIIMEAFCLKSEYIKSQIAKFMGPTWAHVGLVGPRWALVGPINLAIRGASGEICTRHGLYCFSLSFGTGRFHPSFSGLLHWHWEIHMIAPLLRTYYFTATSFNPYMESVGSSEGQRWGYVRTRPEASMFWWLYHSTHPDGYINRPLVIWLQVGLL